MIKRKQAVAVHIGAQRALALAQGLVYNIALALQPSAAQNPGA